MRVLAVSNMFPPGSIGGYELGAFELLRSLAALGHQVCVLTSDYPDGAGAQESPLEVHRSLEWLTVKSDRWPVMHEYEKATFFNPANIRRLALHIRKFSPDIVVLFNIMGLGSLAFAQFVDSCDIPFLLYLMDDVFASIDLAGPHFQRYRSVFGEVAYRNRPIVVAMSKNLTAEIGRIPALLGEDIRIIPGWVHPIEFECSVSGEDRPTRFVFCSRVAEHKGIGILVAAVELTLSRGETEFVVDVYGEGSVPQFVQSVKSKGLEQWIRYSGSLPKDSMTRKLAEYDALLLPTWEREPFGFVVGEAAMAECIPVMTSGIGAAEWFVDGLDCIKIRRDPQPLHWAMVRIMKMSSGERRQMQMAARNTALRVLGFDRWAHKFHAICLELKGRPRGAAPDPLAVEAAFQVLGDLWINKPV